MGLDGPSSFLDLGDLRPNPCGNGRLDENEACDDGNRVDVDACHNDCTINHCVDDDLDTVCNQDDICPGEDDLTDTDLDGIPNGCDDCDDLSVDTDADGLPDECDPCPFDSPDDSDGDGICDSDDMCPDYDDSLDNDGDGVPNLCDICIGGDDLIDEDGDGVPNDCDSCLGFPDDADLDGDSIPDACDICMVGNDLIDNDGDGIPDLCDCDWVTTVCSPLAECYETAAGAACTCWPGYAGDGLTCFDIDECLEDNGGCDPLTACTNIAGSRICGPCPFGYTGDSESGCLTLGCALNNGGCDLLTSCTDTDLGPICGPCPDDYVGDGYTGCYLEIDECALDLDDCDANAYCIDAFSGWDCTCFPGFTGDGFTCSPSPLDGVVLLFLSGVSPGSLIVEALTALDLDYFVATSVDQFNSMFDLNTHDMVIMEVATGMDSGVESRLLSWLEDERPAIIHHSELHETPTYMDLFQLDASVLPESDYTLQPEDGEFDLFTGLTTPVDPSSSDTSYVYQALTPSGGGVLLSHFDDSEGSGAIALTLEDRIIVNGFRSDAYTLTNNDDDSYKDIQELFQNEIALLFNTQIGLSETLFFPTEEDFMNGVAGTCNMWSEGNYHEGTRTLSLGSARSAVIHLDLMINGLSCDSQDVSFSINEIDMGGFSVLPGLSSIDAAFEFPLIEGPEYTFRYETNRTVLGGCGSTCYGLLNSTITLTH
jgi:hypothetical protein